MIHCQPSQPGTLAPLRWAFRCFACGLLAAALAGCGKDSEELVTLPSSSTNQVPANPEDSAPPAPVIPDAIPAQATPSSAPTPLANPVVIPPETDTEATLKQLTRELRRWIVRNQRKPSSYEEFASSVELDVPAPPQGKKYAVSREMKVVLVKR